jgi:hypothetical protein
MPRNDFALLERLRSQTGWTIKYRNNLNSEYLFEVYCVLATLVALTKIEYLCPTNEVRLNAQNQAPYFAPTTGGQDRRIGSAEDIAKRFDPSAFLVRGNEPISLFYQGYPFVNSRLRPDITLIRGKVSTIKSRGIGHSLITVSIQRSLNEEPTIAEVYTNMLTHTGPLPAAYALPQPIRVLPEILEEVTTGKPIGVVRTQMKDYRSTFSPKNTILITQDLISNRSRMADLVLDGQRPESEAFFELVNHLTAYFRNKGL